MSLTQCQPKCEHRFFFFFERSMANGLKLRWFCYNAAAGWSTRVVYGSLIGCFSPQELRSPERPNLQPTNPPSARAARPSLRTAAEPLSASSCEDHHWDPPEQIILPEFDEYKFVDWSIRKTFSPSVILQHVSDSRGARNIPETPNPAQREASVYTSL